MELKGGIDTYSREGSRYGSQEPPLGRKVEFLNENGYDSQLEEARKVFTPGQLLTVQEIYVGRSSSDVVFVEVPGKRFNTVMFGDVDQ